jgi:hypothetical protein
MLIPIGSPGKKYRATVAGEVTKQVTCEKCRCEYVYQLRRQGTGSAKAALFASGDKEARRAAADAQTELRRQLNYEDDPVPCPDCGWLQKTMVKEMRGSRAAGFFLLGAAVTFVWWVFSVATDFRHGPPHPMLVALGVGVLIFAVGTFATYKLWDPNMKSPEWKAKAAKAQGVRRAEYEKQVAEQEALWARTAPPAPAGPTPPPLVQPLGGMPVAGPPPLVGPPPFGPGRGGPAGGPQPMPRR